MDNTTSITISADIDRTWVNNFNETCSINSISIEDELKRYNARYVRLTNSFEFETEHDCLMFMLQYAQ